MKLDFAINWHISLSDLFKTVKKEKKKLFLIFLFLTTLTFYKSLSTPISYTAEGVFKASSGNNSPVFRALDFISNVESSSGEEKPMDVLDSYGVLSRVVKTLCLQGCISDFKTTSRLSTFWKNIVLEGTIKNLKTRERPPSPILDGKSLIPSRHLTFTDEPALSFKDLFYDAEIYTILSIKFLDEAIFEVVDNKKNLLGVGKLDSPFYFEYGQFTLTKLKQTISVAGAPFSLSFIPLKYAVDGLAKKIKLEKNPDKSSLINISYTSGQRNFAASIVNSVMDCYRLYLMDIAKDKIDKQLLYLNQRKKETLTELDSLMGNHQQYLKNHIFNGGFLLLESEASFMTGKQATLMEQLSKLKLQIQNVASTLYPNIPAEFNFLLDFLKKEKKRLFAESQAYAAVNIEKIEEIFANYLSMIDKLDLEKRHYLHCLKKLNEPDAEIASLIKTFSEPTILPFLQQIQSIYAQINDNKNWSEKERLFAKEDLETRKDLLKKELLNLSDARELQKNVIVDKLIDLQKLFLHLLCDEYEKITRVLKELINKEASFPEKWFKEKQIDLHGSIAKNMIEQISRAIEGKNIGFNMSAADSYPLEYALSPIVPNPPKLVKKSLMSGFGGVFVFLFFLLIKHLYTGPTASFENLKGAKKKVMGKITFFDASTFTSLSEKDQDILKKLSFSLCNSKKEKMVVLLSSTLPMPFIYPLFDLLKERKEKIALLDMEEGKEEWGLVDYLRQEKETLLFVKKPHVDILPFGKKTPFKEEYLNSSRFTQALTLLKESYDWIFILNHSFPTTLETKLLLPHADLVIYLASDEWLYDLKDFPPNTLFLNLDTQKLSEINKIKSFLKQEQKTYLSDMKPLISIVQKNLATMVQKMERFHKK